MYGGGLSRYQAQLPRPHAQIIINTHSHDIICQELTAEIRIRLYSYLKFNFPKYGTKWYKCNTFFPSSFFSKSKTTCMVYIRRRVKTKCVYYFNRPFIFSVTFDLPFIIVAKQISYIIFFLYWKQVFTGQSLRIINHFCLKWKETFTENWKLAVETVVSFPA